MNSYAEEILYNKDKLLKALEEFTPALLCKELGCNEKTIYRWMQRHNIPSHYGKKRKETQQLIKEGVKEAERESEKHGLTMFRRIKAGSSYRFRCVECANDYSKKYRKDNWIEISQLQIVKRKQLLKLFGNKCELCKYSKHSGALQFHHIDYKEKKFTLTNRAMTRNWHKVIEEANKCILLCANCHIAVENGLLSCKGSQNNFNQERFKTINQIKETGNNREIKKM